mmetsp:Transcript_72391/g.172909  ORF Transcript_72391/g.172909 Transcript_72391/m.172909 type:complete len:378 (+) Transcript_72391:61-1194(+)
MLVALSDPTLQLEAGAQAQPGPGGHLQLRGGQDLRGVHARDVRPESAALSVIHWGGVREQGHLALFWHHLGIFHDKHQRRVNGARHRIHHCGHQKGEAVVVVVRHVPPNEGGAAPDPGAEGLQGVPAAALGGGGVVEEDGLVEGRVGVGHARPHEVGHQRHGKALRLGQDHEGHDARHEAQEGGPGAAHALCGLLQDLDEEGDGQRLHHRDGQDLRRGHAPVQLPEEVEVFDGHTSPDHGHEVRDGDQERHGACPRLLQPLLAGAQDQAVLLLCGPRAGWGGEKEEAQAGQGVQNRHADAQDNPQLTHLPVVPDEQKRHQHHPRAQAERQVVDHRHGGCRLHAQLRFHRVRKERVAHRAAQLRVDPGEDHRGVPPGH